MCWRCSCTRGADPRLQHTARSRDNLPCVCVRACLRVYVCATPPGSVSCRTSSAAVAVRQVVTAHRVTPVTAVPNVRQLTQALHVQRT